MDEFWVQRIKEEYDKAVAKFSYFASPHEGYAIILEELDELWDAIKMQENGVDEKGRTREQAMEEEATQVGAMALRFLIDCIYYESLTHQLKELKIKPAEKFEEGDE